MLKKDIKTKNQIVKMEISLSIDLLRKKERIKKMNDLFSQHKTDKK